MIQKTNPIRPWKQWLALPLAAVLFITVACEKAAPPAEPASPTATAQDAQVPPPPPAPMPGQVAPPPPPAVYNYVEQMPQLPGRGGNQAIVAAIQQRLAYPNVVADSLRTGRVFVSFIVSEQGEVQAPQVVKGLGTAYDAAVLAAVQQLPKFEPGRQAGKAVAVSFTVPVLFANATGQSNSASRPKITVARDENNKPVTKVSR